MAIEQEKLLHWDHKSERERDLDLRSQSNESLHEEIRRLNALIDDLRTEVFALRDEVERLQNLV
jgi:predicted RNase H-like nuclease (RuvC/YqgF family)